MYRSHHTSRDSVYFQFSGLSVSSLCALESRYQSAVQTPNMVEQVRSSPSNDGFQAISVVESKGTVWAAHNDGRIELFGEKGWKKTKMRKDVVQLVEGANGVVALGKKEVVWMEGGEEKVVVLNKEAKCAVSVEENVFVVAVDGSLMQVTKNGEVFIRSKISILPIKVVYCQSIKSLVILSKNKLSIFSLENNATISTTIQDSNHIVAVDTPEGVKIYVAHSGRTVSFGLYFYASLTADIVHEGVLSDMTSSRKCVSSGFVRVKTGNEWIVWICLSGSNSSFICIRDHLYSKPKDIIVSFYDLATNVDVGFILPHSFSDSTGYFADDSKDSLWCDPVSIKSVDLSKTLSFNAITITCSGVVNFITVASFQEELLKTVAKFAPYCLTETATCYRLFCKAGFLNTSSSVDLAQSSSYLLSSLLRMSFSSSIVSHCISEMYRDGMDTRYVIEDPTVLIDWTVSNFQRVRDSFRSNFLSQSTNDAINWVNYVSNYICGLHHIILTLINTRPMSAVSTSSCKSLLNAVSMELDLLQVLKYFQLNSEILPLLNILLGRESVFPANHISYKNMIVARKVAFQKLHVYLKHEFGINIPELSDLFIYQIKGVKGNFPTDSIDLIMSNFHNFDLVYYFLVDFCTSLKLFNFLDKFASEFHISATRCSELSSFAYMDGLFGGTHTNYLEFINFNTPAPYHGTVLAGLFGLQFFDKANELASLWPVENGQKDQLVVHVLIRIASSNLHSTLLFIREFPEPMERLTGCALYWLEENNILVSWFSLPLDENEISILVKFLRSKLSPPLNNVESLRVKRVELLIMFYFSRGLIVQGVNEFDYQEVRSLGCILSIPPNLIAGYRGMCHVDRSSSILPQTIVDSVTPVKPSETLRQRKATPFVKSKKNMDIDSDEDMTDVISLNTKTISSLPLFS